MSGERFVLVFALTGSVAANANGVWDQVVSSGNGSKGLITKARFMPSESVTADNSNYFDLSVEINTTEIASEQTTSSDTGDLTAGTEIELALSSTVSLEVADGDRLTVKKTKAGTGAVASGTVTIEGGWYRAP